VRFIDTEERTMKQLITPLLALVAVAAALHSPEALAGTEARTVPAFEAISTHGSIDLTVRQTDKAAVSVTADDKVLPLVETVVENNTLVVRMKKGERFWNTGTISVAIDVVKLNAISSAGSGDVVLNGLKSPSFKLTLAGSSDAKLNGLTTESTELRISGSGDVLATGQSRNVAISISGSGDANFSGLTADDVSVKIAGSGDASVNANKSLSVSVAGSGDVTYTGGAQALKVSMAGSGTLTKK
jgi:hypothetical protein